jgi:putative transposase
VVAWELSESLEMDFVIACSSAALKGALPEIVNSDQGSHFTSERFTKPLQEAGVQISMDGRGRCMDNIFTERLWRSVKYEEVYLSEYATPREARQGLSRYLCFYKEQRPHKALGYRTPSRVYSEVDCQDEEEDSLKPGPKVS